MLIIRMYAGSENASAAMTRAQPDDDGGGDSIDWTHLGIRPHHDLHPKLGPSLPEKLLPLLGEASSNQRQAQPC